MFRLLTHHRRLFKEDVSVQSSNNGQVEKSSAITVCVLFVQHTAIELW